MSREARSFEDLISGKAMLGGADQISGTRTADCLSNSRLAILRGCFDATIMRAPANYKLVDCRLRPTFGLTSARPLRIGVEITFGALQAAPIRSSIGFNRETLHEMEAILGRAFEGWTTNDGGEILQSKMRHFCNNLEVFDPKPHYTEA